jgi:D-ribulokinase
MTKPTAQADTHLYLGIDFGTSGCRAIVIDAKRQQLAETSYPLPAAIQHQQSFQQQASIWIEGLHALIKQLSAQIELTQIQRIAIDGTSGSVLLVSPQGKVLTPALMYNDSSGQAQQRQIQQHCPDPQHIVNSASSPLAKALQLAHSLPAGTSYLILNQADYLSNYLANRWGFSDYHNSLKMGYDVQQRLWPQWIGRIVPQTALPQVLEPGQVFATADTEIAEQLGLNKNVQICAGSTDANAAFIATESTQAGNAVTSLGSTIVLKILSHNPVQDLQSGVYSHKLGDYWLCGGASNAGASVLKQYFSDNEIKTLSQQIDINKATQLNYYPLPATGERFPTMEPHKQPVLTPRPTSDIEFLQGILEGLSRIEQQGYQKLKALGAAEITRIQTLGGGAVNPQWQAMRSQMLGIPVSRAKHTQAAYGSALLALQGLKNYQQT